MTMTTSASIELFLLFSFSRLVSSPRRPNHLAFSAYAGFAACFDTPVDRN